MAKCRKKKKIAQVRMTMAQMAEAKRRPLSREEPEQKQERNKGIRALVDCQIRAVEGEGNERTFVLSFYKMVRTGDSGPYRGMRGPDKTQFNRCRSL